VYFFISWYPALVISLGLDKEQNHLLPVK